MILWNSQELVFDDTPSEIVRWVVWFQTPFGLMEKFDEAIKRCSVNDIDPALCVSPVSIAIDKLGRYKRFS